MTPRRESSPSTGGVRPRVMVVGLGPAGPELVPEAAFSALAGAARAFVRTERHPSVSPVAFRIERGLESFDRLYESGGTFEEVYRDIVEELVAAALVAAGEAAGGYVAYAVPGSPFVAERTVVMLKGDGRVAVDVVPAPSFLDLAWDRLGIDPIAAGVRLVDGGAFAVEAAGERGPLLVAQCHSRQVLSDIKLAGDDAEGEDDDRTAVFLHHLGLADEEVREVAWAELDRSLEPDHLTAVWVPELAAPVAAELVRLDELVHRLRTDCPWDRKQTHGSLAGHLLEETYETLDAIEVVAGSEPEAVAGSEPEVSAEDVDHLAEELGDLLFQVYFHAVLAGEEGRFTLADVARGVHQKLVGRHPHVFGEVVLRSADEVASNWEVLKMGEKGRTSVTEGIPGALPALALAAKLQKKAESVGLEGAGLDESRRAVADGMDGLEAASGPEEMTETLGRLLFALADVARKMGVDPETALRQRSGEFRREIEARESGGPSD